MRRPGQKPAPPAPSPTAAQSPSTAAATPPSESKTRDVRTAKILVWVLAVLWLGCVVVAAAPLLEDQDVWTPSARVARIAAAGATWVVVAMLARRTGGRTVLLSAFAAVVLGLVTAYPEDWALAGAAAAAAGVHGLLGMLITRPAAGLRAMGELVISAAVGVGGAVAVSAYDVELRHYRFRLLVLLLVLIAALVLAHRLGHGIGSLGRRGLVLISAGVVLLLVSVAYTQAIIHWGSPELVDSLVDGKAWLRDHLGAVPRPIEAFVGFPALVWGVAIRNRRRQGWWMCAFGALGAAGVATSLVRPGVGFEEALIATGYNVVIGGLLGLLIVAIDRVMTGPRGKRVHQPEDLPLRPEPARFEPLL